MEGTLRGRPGPATGDDGAPGRANRRSGRRSPFAWLALLILATGAIALDASVVPSPLLPALPPGVGAPRWLSRVAEAVGFDRLSPGWAVAAATLLMAAAVGAFLAILVAAWRGRLSTRAALGWSAALLLAVTLVPPLLSRDVSSYAIYGRIWAVHGENPYIVLPSAFPGDPFRTAISEEWVRTPSVYGPAFTLLSGAIVRTFRSPAATTAAFKVVAALAVLGSAWLAARVAARIRPGREAFAAAMVGLNPAMIIHVAGGAHNDALVGLAAVAGLWAWSGGRRLAATVVLTIGALVKAVAGIPLVLAVVAVGLSARGTKDPLGTRRPAREVLLHLGAVAGLTVALFLPFGLSGGTLRAFAGLASRQGWASPARLVARGAEAIGRSLGGQGLADGLSAVVRVAFLLVFVAVLARLIMRIRRDPLGASPPAVAEDWGTALLVFTLAAAYLLPWYVAWFVPLVAVMGQRLPVVAGAALCALVALTGIPAEPAFAPGTWSTMLLVVHYVVAPAVLVLLVVVAVRSLRGRATEG